MDEISVFINTAVAVAEKAMEQGIARRKRTRQDLRETAEFLITSSREKTRLMMESGLIKEPPTGD
jgi:malate dehydrogenase (oxaloacetate-decarboxylating)